jgi:kynurenine formamidase
VRTGRILSLSRPWPKEPAPGNTHPAQHFMQRIDKEDGAGLAEDFIGAAFHGKTVTHIDALCHTWDKDGMWNGRSPDDEVGFSGTRWGGIEAWSDGLITRGVLLDVPRHRNQPFVTTDHPVHGWELEEIAKAQGTEIGPGDAVVVYSGREAWDRERDAWAGLSERPGLDASCLWFLREHDCSAIVWDMTDRMPNGYNLPFGVHSAIFAYGLALIDMALLEPLARACREENRCDFMLVVSPLLITGGTGSPVNPLAVF